MGKKISEEREIVERNGQKIEIIWETYEIDDVKDVNIKDKKRMTDNKIENKISTLNNKTSKFSKNNKGIKIK
jgi:hypothetical protein